jgi:hypothetical protein
MRAAGHVIGIGALPPQARQQVMGAGMARRQGEQRFERRVGLVHRADEIERGGVVVTIVEIVRRLRHGMGEMRQRGGMVAQAGIDAAHRVAAQRIVGQGLLGFGQNLRGGAVLSRHDQQPRQLRAIFARGSRATAAAIRAMPSRTWPMPASARPSRNSASA